MSDLKPCPFCGGTKIKMYSPYSPDLHGFVHLCEINGEAMIKVESRFFKTEEEAVEAWNRGVLNVPDTNVGDTISRQAAIDTFYKRPNIKYTTLDVLAILKTLPSAQPKRKTGSWTEKHHAYADEEKVIEEWQSCKCSVCGRYDTRPYLYYFNEPNFCSWCGADMRGGEHNG